MEIIVKINELKDISLIDNADSYLLANKNFSMRYKHSFTFSEIKKVKDKLSKLNKKTYILVNSIFKDNELDDLKDFLDHLNKIDIDGIFFTDFAVFMIAKELKMEDKCYFYHETFLRNSLDVKTYQELGIKNIILSKDMHINDIANLNPLKKDSYGILCFGYVPIYESKRKVLTNYIKQNNLDKSLLNSFDLTLNEKTRPNVFYKMIEQNGIASIFNNEVLCYIDYMQKLKENVNMFIFDSLFFEASYIKEVIESFKNEKTLDDVSKLDESITLSSIFIDKKVGLI